MTSETSAVALETKQQPWWLTLITGVLALIVGALLWQPTPELRAFLAVGVLGAFTTFSTFSLDTVLLYERGDLLLCAVYVAGSVLLSVGAFFVALMLVRAVVT